MTRQAELTGVTEDDNLTLTITIDGAPHELTFDDESARRLYFVAGEHVGAFPNPSPWGSRRRLFLDPIKFGERVYPVFDPLRKPD